MSRLWLCVLASLACGCSVVPIEDLESEADRLRDTAMKNFEAGDAHAALALNRRAIEVASRLPETSWRTVENYDDAGLYYYWSENWEQSARYQSIAVLLACGTQENAPMFAAYVERLGWAFAKYRPRQDFRPIAENPLLLLDDAVLGLRNNADLRRRYFIRYPAPATSRSSKPRYLSKLRGDASEACHPNAR